MARLFTKFAASPFGSGCDEEKRRQSGRLHLICVEKHKVAVLSEQNELFEALEIEPRDGGHLLVYLDSGKPDTRMVFVEF